MNIILEWKHLKNLGISGKEANENCFKVLRNHSGKATKASFVQLLPFSFSIPQGKGLLPARCACKQLGGFPDPSPPSFLKLPNSSQDTLAVSCTPAANLCLLLQSPPEGAQHVVSIITLPEKLICKEKAKALTHRVWLLHILAVELTDPILHFFGILNEAHTIMKICFKSFDESFHILLLQEWCRYILTWLIRALYRVRFSTKPSRTGESSHILYFHLIFKKYVIKKHIGDVSTTCRIAVISFSSNNHPRCLR